MTYTETQKEIQDIFRLMAEAITEHHKDLKIDVAATSKRLIVNLTPHDDDLGKMIGKRAQTETAFKMIAAAMGVKRKMEIVYLLSRRAGDSRPKYQFRADQNWDNEGVRGIFEKICSAIFVGKVEVTARDIGDSSILTGKLADLESLRNLIQDIETPLGIIFHAIAKAQGRNEIFIELA